MGTVGDYKEMKVSFEVDTNKTPYHATPYRISVAHTPLVKTAIKYMVKKQGVSRVLRRQRMGSTNLRNSEE